ncbi:MAG: ASKHA domain-containing protein [Lachnospiraceae bacterium]
MPQTEPLKPSNWIKRHWSRTYSVIGDPGTKPVGLCGSGIIDMIAELFRCGVTQPERTDHPGGQTDPQR